MGRPNLLSRRTAIALACNPFSGRDASLQSLQPTNCHEYPRSHATSRLWAFAFCPPRPSRASCWVGAQPSARAFLGDAELPLLASPALDRPRSWCCTGRLRPNRHPKGSRGVPRSSPTRPSQPNSSPTIRPTDAPCRSARTMLGIPSTTAGARTRSAHPNQRMGLCEPEAPSTDKSHRRRPSSRPDGDRMSRHRYPGLAAEDPASDTLSRSIPRSARPKRLPAVHRGAQATYRLSASAMERPPSTPTFRPTSGVPMANHAPPDGAAPFGAPPAGLSQARGRLAFRPRQPPPRRPLALVDLP